MPELPDVENFRRYLERTALHKKITDIEVSNNKVLHGISADRLRKGLKGRQIEETRRHGKHLLVRLDNGSWVTFHFGMTGRFAAFRKPEDEPRHDRIRFDFVGDDHLAFVDQRLFGEVGLVDDADGFVQQRELGQDALDPALDENVFREMVRKHRGSVKSLLMNQKVIAGIGNEYSDEILFQAGLHPETRTNDLQAGQIAKLYRRMKKVLNAAIDRGAGSEDFLERLPSEFLLPRREEGAQCPVCETPIRTAKISGRTAYYCPRCQSVPAAAK